MIIFGADFHIHPYWHYLHEDGRYTLRQTVQIAKKNNAAAVVFPGDTFDPVRSSTLAVYNEELKDCPVPVYGIDGQHDHDEPSWISVEGVVGEDLHLHAVELDGHCCYGIRNCSSEELKACLKAIPKEVDVLVLHQLVRSLLESRGWDLDEAWIPKHVKWVFSGDSHKADSFAIPGGVGYYCGAPIPQRINEVSNPRGIIAFDNNKVEYVQLKSRVFHHYIVTDNQAKIRREIKALSESPQYENLPPIIYIEYALSDESRDFVSKLRADFSDIVWKVYPRIPESHMGTVHSTGSDKMEDIVGQFTTNVNIQRYISEGLKDRKTALTNFRRAELPKELYQQLEGAK